MWGCRCVFLVFVGVSLLLVLFFADGGTGAVRHFGGAGRFPGGLVLVVEKLG